VIRSFRHRGMEAFFTANERRKLPADRIERISRMLDRLDAAKAAQDMNLPGFGFHPLKGDRKGTYAVKVSGNLRMTFRFEGEDALDVDLEEYHE
jgi:toxin HigB-1